MPVSAACQSGQPYAAQKKLGDDFFSMPLSIDKKASVRAALIEEHRTHFAHASPKMRRLATIGCCPRSGW